jgi:hypothetical protein
MQAPASTVRTEGAEWLTQRSPPTGGTVVLESWDTTGIREPSDVGSEPADVGSEPPDFSSMVDRRSRELVERIELKLLEDREEADCSGDTAPTARAFHTCLSLAQRLAPHVALAPRLKSGAFTEDNGGVSLVLQSLVTDRRLNCRIAPDGVAVSAIRIDERMRASSAPVALNDPNVPKELAEWVTSRV